MTRENHPLVVDEPVAFEKSSLGGQDFQKTTEHVKRV